MLFGVESSTPQGWGSFVEFTLAAPPRAVTTLDTHQNYVGPSASSLEDDEASPATGAFDSYLDPVSSPSSPCFPPVTIDAVASLGLSSHEYSQS